MQSKESSETVLKIFHFQYNYRIFTNFMVFSLKCFQRSEENSDESEDQPSVITPAIVTVNVEEIESTAEEISEAITLEAIQEANQYNQDNSQNVNNNNNNNNIESNNQNHCNEDSDEDIDIK